jgi:hypothetical protein
MGIEEFVLDRERRIGRKEGLAQAKELLLIMKNREAEGNFVIRLLNHTECSEEKISDLADVDINFVKKIKELLT